MMKKTQIEFKVNPMKKILLLLSLLSMALLSSCEEKKSNGSNCSGNTCRISDRKKLVETPSYFEDNLSFISK